MALGDFAGGCLCAEGGIDGDTELRVDVRGRLARLDGRGVHWVSGWTGEERYSVVFFSSSPAHFTAQVAQEAHLEWAEARVGSEGLAGRGAEGEEDNY